MTTRRAPLSDKERAYLMAFLFPPLWPLGIAMLLCDACAGGKEVAEIITREWNE